MKNLLSRELRIVNRQWSIVNDYTLNTQHSTLNKKTKKPPCFTARRLYILVS